MTEDYLKRRSTISKRAENAYHEARIPRDNYPLYPRNAFPHYKTMFVHEKSNNKNTMSQTIRTIYLSKSNRNSSPKSNNKDLLLQSKFESKYRSLFKEREERRYQRESKYSPSNWTEPLGLHSTYVRSFRKPVKISDDETHYASQIKEYLERKDKRLRKKYDLNEVDYEESLRRNHKRESRNKNTDSNTTRSRRDNAERRKKENDDDNATRVRKRRSERRNRREVETVQNIKNDEQIPVVDNVEVETIQNKEEEYENVEQNQVYEKVEEAIQNNEEISDEKVEEETILNNEEEIENVEQIQVDEEVKEVNENNAEDGEVKLESEHNENIKEEIKDIESVTEVVESGEESTA